MYFSADFCILQNYVVFGIIGRNDQTQQIKVMMHATFVIVADIVIVADA